MASSFEEEKEIYTTRTGSHDKPMAKVSLHGDGEEFVILGDKKFYRHELMTAFGGTLQSERFAPQKEEKFGNAAAVGLSAFATSAFVLGLCLAGAKGIAAPNITVGLCFFYGGVVQAAAGVWELVLGNTFAGTVLCSFGLGFWMSFGAINVEAFGIMAAYGDDTAQLGNAIGFYLVGWGIFTFLMLLCTVKTTVMFMGLFFTLDIAFFLLAGYYFTAKPKLLQVGGIFVIFAAMCGWFCAFAGVASRHNSYFTANPILLPVFGAK